MRPSPIQAALGLAVMAAAIVAGCSSAYTSAPSPTTVVAGATAIPVSAPVLGVRQDPNLAAFLTGADGMTLYVFDTDAADKSNCGAGCATTWPPLTVAPSASLTGPFGATGTFATIVRSDGTTQVTYDHRPLYYYAGDSMAGDTNGQGVDGVWFVASVGGSAQNVSTPAANAAATAGATTAPAADTAAPTQAGYSGY
jgi:predicted lipoprotein with Yx(FWY)xxD motif